MENIFQSLIEFFKLKEFEEKFKNQKTNHNI